MSEARTPLSRRGMLAGMAGIGTTLVLKAFEVRAAEDADPRISALVHKTIGIDAHNHIDVALYPDRVAQPDIDLAEEMKRSGLSAICMVFALDYQKIVDPEDGYKRLINGLDAADAQLQRNHMQRSLTAADVRSAHDAGRPTVIQAIEGAHWLDGRLERIEAAYERGLRHFGLFHDSDAIPPLGDTNTPNGFGQATPPHYGGLTTLGVDVIRECNRLGMLIDLAHASAETTTAAIKTSKAPMVFSHTGLDTRLDDDPDVAKILFSKLVSKEQARAIADSGGVVGVWTHLSETPQAYGQNVRAMVDVCGIDHVCIGTDSKLTPALNVTGEPPRPRDAAHQRSIGGATKDIWPNMPFGFYYAIVDGLLKAGFTPDEIGKIGGGNYLRVFNAAATHKG